MLLLDEGVHIDGRDSTEKVNVVVRVELGHFPLRCRLGTLKMRRVNLYYSLDAPFYALSTTYEYLHLFVQPIVHNERMAHAYARWFHPGE